MGLKLYEIDALLERLLMLPNGDAVDTETGEIFSDENIEELQLAREAKIEGCLLFAKNEEAEAKALREEAAKLIARAEACENRAERARNYAKFALNGEKFKTTKVAVSYRTNKKVEVTCDVNNLPDEYKTVKVTVNPNKVELKKAIEAGKTIEGVILVESKSMTVK